MPNVGEVLLPQPAVAEEPEALFDSRRSYPEQLFAYRRHKNGGNDEIIEGAQLQMLIEACRANGIDCHEKNQKSGPSDIDGDRLGNDDDDDDNE